MYENLCFPYHFKHEKMIKVSPLYPKIKSENVKDCFTRMKPNTFFIAEEGGIPDNCTYWINVVRLEHSLYVFNHEFIIHLKDDVVTSYDQPNEQLWKQLFLEIGHNNLDFNHYEYLELVIDSFWKQVFDKTREEMWCSGIITSHGDKCYGYEHDWKEHGIPFKRGALIFLLSYTKELGDRPKHETCEWVIEKYPHYLPMIEEAEKKAGL